MLGGTGSRWKRKHFLLSLLSTFCQDTILFWKQECGMVVKCEYGIVRHIDLNLYVCIRYTLYAIPYICRTSFVCSSCKSHCIGKLQKYSKIFQYKYLFIRVNFQLIKNSCLNFNWSQCGWYDFCSTRYSCWPRNRVYVSVCSNAKSKEAKLLFVISMQTEKYSNMDGNNNNCLGWHWLKVLIITKWMVIVCVQHRRQFPHATTIITQKKSDRTHTHMYT